MLNSVFYVFYTNLCNDSPPLGGLWFVYEFGKNGV